MKKKLALLITILSIILLVGCRSKEAGGGVDILLFLQNPVVMVIGGILIAYWMLKRSK